MRSRIFLKLAVSFLLVIAVATFTLDLLIRRAWERSLRADLEQSLTEKALLFAQQLEAGGAAPVEVAARVEQATSARATIIDHAGRVLADSEADPAAMENHARRPEFAAALAGRAGSDVRRSHTVGVDFLYVAVPARNGAVRLAYPISYVQQRTAEVRRSLFGASALAVLLAMALAAGLAHWTARRLRRIVHFAERIAAGDLTARIDERSFDELGALARALDQTVHQLERVERTRRDFIANVSHELRTPLTSIQGYAETLLDSRELPPAQREFVEVLLQNARRMARLTEDLLTLARVESGEQRLELEPVPAPELLETAARNLRPAAEARGLRLEVEPPPAENVAVDRDAIHQVLVNLVDNAGKYGAAGGRIVLGAARKDKVVEFYVRDFGAGIAAEHLPRLFERFYRVDRERSRETGGTGLGLAIVKHIVRKHGGAVRVESTPGGGSIFYFSVPAAPPAERRASGPV